MRWRLHLRLAGSHGRPMPRARMPASTQPVTSWTRLISSPEKLENRLDPARSSMPARWRSPFAPTHKRAPLRSACALPACRFGCGPTRIYSLREEVRDVVAYLRLAHCPTDAPALAR